MSNGPALLKKYLKSTGQKPADISRATNIDRSLISRWLRDEEGRRPGLEHACEIERVTQGAVPACSWLSKKKRSAA